MLKKIIIVMLSVILFSTKVLAVDWVKKPIYEDNTYKYFIGKAISEKSIILAEKDADIDAINQAKRLFGFEFNSLTQMYRNNGDILETNRYNEVTLNNINLQGLEKIEVINKEKNDIYESIVVYRFPKKNIIKEEQRLTTLNEKKDILQDINYNSVGDNVCSEGTSVEITTNFNDAKVSIDNGNFVGLSPLKIVCLKSGIHNLTITKANYETINEQIIVSKEPIRIHKILQEKIITFTVSAPSDAEVYVNTKYIGKGNVMYKGLANEVLNIVVKHKDFKDYYAQVKLSYDMIPRLNVTMNKAEGILDFTEMFKKYPNIKIYVDYNTLVTSNTINLEAGKHNVMFMQRIDNFVNSSEEKYTIYPNKVTEVDEYIHQFITYGD